MVFGGYPDNPGFSILRALIIPAKTLPHKVTLPGSKELGPNSFEAAIQPTGTYYYGICLIFFFFLVATPHGTYDFSSLTRDQTSVPCIETGVLTTRPPGRPVIFLFPLFLLH